MDLRQLAKVGAALVLVAALTKLGVLGGWMLEWGPWLLLVAFAVALLTFVTARLGIVARRAIRWGGGLVLVGLSLVGSGPSDAGAALTLVGLYVLIVGIHQFGRLGPDAASSPR
jgi:hypothetical protein